MGVWSSAVWEVRALVPLGCHGEPRGSQGASSRLRALGWEEEWWVWDVESFPCDCDWGGIPPSQVLASRVEDPGEG